MHLTRGAGPRESRWPFKSVLKAPRVERRALVLIFPLPKYECWCHHTVHAFSSPDHRVHRGFCIGLLGLLKEFC